MLLQFNVIINNDKLLIYFMFGSEYYIKYLFKINVIRNSIYIFSLV